MTNHQDTSAEHERFESLVHGSIKRHSIYIDQYEDPDVQEKWSLWQAALASRDEAAGPSELKPVHSRCKDRCQEAIWCPEGRCALAAQQPQGQTTDHSKLLKMMPLSDAQIAEISVECAIKSPSDIVFARAIESAHGITAKEQGNGN